MGPRGTLNFKAASSARSGLRQGARRRREVPDRDGRTGPPKSCKLPPASPPPSAIRCRPCFERSRFSCLPQSDPYRGPTGIVTGQIKKTNGPASHGRFNLSLSAVRFHIPHHAIGW